MEGSEGGDPGRFSGDVVTLTECSCRTGTHFRICLDQSAYARKAGRMTSRLEHLQTGQPVTQDTAREKYGCRHLASRISELKKAGHVILSLRNSQGCAMYLLLSDEGGRE